MFGSSVVPDFEETMKIVRRGSFRAEQPATAEGSVESSTSRRGKPGADPKVCSKT